MRSIQKKLLAVFGGLLLASTAMQGQAQTATPDNWRCTNSVGGEWNFGRAPNGCDASTFGPDSLIRNSYAPLNFVDGAERVGERKRYMQEMYSFIKQAAGEYIVKRKPNVSAEEKAAFQLASLTIAHQESYWTHYRTTTDGRIKMMRGDFGHGHGFMQIDDRWHYSAINAGKAWNLVLNYTYAIEIYYAGWQKAPSQWCLAGSANTWRNRSRAAFGVYNGGDSKVCRWTNPNDTWARNDIGFAQKYDGQSWNTFVADKNKATTINVSCLMDGGTNCPPLGNAPADVSWASPNAGSTVINGTPFTFDASARTASLILKADIFEIGRSSTRNVNNQFVVTPTILNTLGNRNFFVEAYDAAGTKLDTESAAFTISNLQFATPSSGAIVNARTSFAVTARAVAGTAKVEYYADTFLLGTATSSSNAYKLDVTLLSTGARVLKAVSYNAAGTKLAETTRNITVR